MIATCIKNACNSRFHRFPPIAHTLSSPRTIRTPCASVGSAVVLHLVCNQRFLNRNCGDNLEGLPNEGRVYRSGTGWLPISCYSRKKIRKIKQKGSREILENVSEEISKFTAPNKFATVVFVSRRRLPPFHRKPNENFRTTSP